jgi:hypothetical protein
MTEPIAYYDFQERGFYWANNVVHGPVPVTVKVDPMPLYAAPVTKVEPVEQTRSQKLTAAGFTRRKKGFGKEEDDEHRCGGSGCDGNCCVPVTKVELVAWEFRYKESNKYTANYGEWGEWERLVPRNPLETIEGRVAEMRRYIADGYNYELRALYTHPALTAKGSFASHTAEGQGTLHAANLRQANRIAEQDAVLRMALDVLEDNRDCVDERSAPQYMEARYDPTIAAIKEQLK